MDAPPESLSAAPPLPVADLAVLALLSLLMVLAMVRFSRAILARVEAGGDTDPEPRAFPSRLRWGLAYAGLWCALVVAIFHLLDTLDASGGEGMTKHNLVIVAAVVLGFWAVHAVLLWLAAALIRANRRAFARPYLPAAPPSPGSRPYGGGWSDEPAAPDEPVAPEEPVAPPTAPSLRQRLRGLLRGLLTLAVVFVFLVVGAAVPALRQLDGWFATHQGLLLPWLVAVTALGFVLLLGGGIHMVLTAGTPASRREIEELARRQHRLASGSGGWQAVRVRPPVDTIGASASDSASFAEIKAAFRARAWQVSPRWRRLFAMFLGAALLAVGLFGVAIVLAPAGLKLLCAAALVYAAGRTAVALIRA